jgi:TatD DNase family protein
LKLFDAHAHLQDERYCVGLDAVIARAREAGVTRLACCGTSEEDWAAVARLAGTQDWIVPSFGLHPWYVADRTGDWLERLTEYLVRFPNAGVGEAGLDYKIDPITFPDQADCLVAQLELAHRLNRPVSLHCRKAWGSLGELLSRFPAGEVRVLIHSYSGSPESVADMARFNVYYSFSCTLTFSGNRRAAKAILCVPPDRLLLETDSPDLPPQGSEGALNEPANIHRALQAASRLLNVPEAALAEQTYANGCRFFGVAP